MFYVLSFKFWLVPASLLLYFDLKYDFAELMVNKIRYRRQDIVLIS